MLSRRDFVKLFGGAVATLETSLARGGWEGTERIEGSNGAQEEDEEEALVFDGTGIKEAPRKPSNHTDRETYLVEKKISHPLWLMRADEVFRIDVATVKGYKAAQWALRDIQAGRMGFPDVSLLTALSRSQVALATLNRHSRYDITSGMRTVGTNNKTEGAALGSLHTPDKKGEFLATDFRAAGFDAAFTARLMRMVGMGGVGMYVQRDFVHADTGRKRSWRGN
jgi:uncharacterized protein YcbK (DUF882 family)